MPCILCENEFCIYQKEGRCVLESICLDVQGNCVDCIYITVERDVLDGIKQKLLKDLDVSML